MDYFLLYHFIASILGLKLSTKIVKLKNKTLSVPKTKDDSQNVRWNNIGGESNFLLTLGWFEFPLISCVYSI